MFNRDLFRAKIVENGKTMKDAATAIGCSEAALSRKVNGISDFTRNEIQLFRQAFGLSPAEVESIFLPKTCVFVIKTQTRGGTQ